MNLSGILVHACSSDINLRNPAEKKLKQLEEQNLAAYLSGLCGELVDDSKAAPARQLAGLLLKNALVAKEEQTRLHKAQRWLNLNEDVRRQIRAMLLQILSSSHKSVRSTASMVIAKVAAVEIPQNMWGELVDTLVNNITKSNNEHIMESSFAALGYVCEDCGDFLQTKSVQILNAIATGMRNDMTNHDIKYAATVALANSLEFVRENFQKENDRNLIMQMVFSSCGSGQSPQIRVAGYQCLVEIASSYYNFIGPYMDSIFRLTRNAIEKECEEVAQQAIEFWSTISEEEIEIQEELEEAEERGIKSKRMSHNFVAQSLKNNLMPLVLHSLTKQADEISDSDTWNTAMAAGVCLGLISTCVGDAVVATVLPFVQQHITSTNWRFKEAATLSFGCIIEGPKPEVLRPLVQRAFPVLLQHMTDQSPMVKDTAAWTIGRICNFLPETINPAVIPKLMETFAAGLRDIPQVAAPVCWAIHNLASAVEVRESSALSSYFQGVVTALLHTTERPDSNEANLRGSAYEAINVLISTAAPDVYHLVAQLIPTFMGRLQATLQKQNVAGAALETINETQALLCGALQTIIQKLSAAVVTPHADALMSLFLQVLQSKNATIHEEALLAIGAVANRVEGNFEKYMSHFKPYLMFGLQNAQEHHVCTVAVGIVGDLTHALKDKLMRYCDEIMQKLLANLGNPNIERNVKPHIISCFGDIALAIGGNITRYLNFIMMMLQQASQIKFDDMEFDNIEYLNQLRESILEAYTGILQGLSDGKQEDQFLPFVEHIVFFLDMIAKDTNTEDPITRAAVGIIGDMAKALGPKVAKLLPRPSVQNIIMAACRSQEENTKRQGEWAKEAVKQLL